MWVEASDLGPLFKVKPDDDGPEFSGYSPTAPWTDACTILFGKVRNNSDREKVECSFDMRYHFIF